MSAERPIPDNGVMSPEEQARLLVQTGHHTHEDEADKLAEVFGEPDEDGVYGAGVVGGEGEQA